MGDNYKWLVVVNPMASVGAGCYVLWQNIVNSVELWEYRRKVNH